MLARYILHTREMSAVITFVVRRFCSLLVTDPRNPFADTRSMH